MYFVGGSPWLYLDSRRPLLRLCSFQWWPIEGGCAPARGRDQHTCGRLHPVPEWPETEIPTLPPTVKWGYRWGVISTYCINFLQMFSLFCYIIPCFFSMKYLFLQYNTQIYHRNLTVQQFCHLTAIDAETTSLFFRLFNNIYKSTVLNGWIKKKFKTYYPITITCKNLLNKNHPLRLLQKW